MLKERIEQDLKEALKNREAEKVSTLRMLLSSLHNQEIEKRDQLTDEEIVSVIEKEIKKRQEAVEAYQQANREELAKKEEDELELLRNYLPPQLSDEELEDIIKRVIGESPGLPEGPLTGKVMQQVKGQAESRRVVETIKRLLA